MKINNSKSLLRSIDGLKVLSAFNILIGHRLGLTFSGKRYNDVWEKFVVKFMHVYESVDVFFVSSAVLITISQLKAMET